MPNIVQPISAWLEGHTGWGEIVFGNGSGLLRRPLSNLSFAINAAISGLDPLSFKATNLALHLLCGVLIYTLSARLLPRDPQLQKHAKLTAPLVAALWLLHPIQVSTVLYVVQRMAQLSALFALIALLAFVIGRIALEQGRMRAGWTWLFLVLPVATIAAVLSKENGALVPLLCAVVELGYFRASPSLPRPGSIKLFFAAFLLLPGALALAWYGFHFEQYSDYRAQPFTLGERLFTQPRALMDYLGALLLPRGPSLGVYTDDFVVSRGLLSPPSTLLAIFALAALAVFAFLSRLTRPAIFTGIGLFLAGHAMESSVFPLELYFEHRNYLPSFGVFLALAGMVGWLLPKLAKRSDNAPKLQKILGGLTVVLLLLLAGGTFARATMWRSAPMLAAQGVVQHPQSMRAHLDYANALQLQGRYADAQQVFDYMMTMDNPAARHAGIIDTVALQCMSKKTTTPEAVARISGIKGSKLQLVEMLAFENLGNFLQKNACENLQKPQLAKIIVEIVDSAPQPADLTQIWRSRFGAATLYASAGMLADAQQQAALAWASGGADLSVGIFLSSLYYHNNDPASARLVLIDARKQVKQWDKRNLTLIAELDQLFGNAPLRTNTSPTEK